MHKTGEEAPRDLLGVKGAEPPTLLFCANGFYLDGSLGPPFSQGGVETARIALQRGKGTHPHILQPGLPEQARQRSSQPAVHGAVI